MSYSSNFYKNIINGILSEDRKRYAWEAKHPGLSYDDYTDTVKRERKEQIWVLDETSRSYVPYRLTE